MSTYAAATPPALPLLQQRVVLAPYTTFGIGGPARWFCSVTSEDALQQACAWAVTHAIPTFVLGGGSNILVADAGFAGLVVHIALRGTQVRTEGDRCVFTVAAGESWDALVSRTVEEDCAGMECLAGIPGTVGGTPVQNVGAYGQEVSQTITAVRCLDRQTGSFRSFSHAECAFAYRQSRFNSGVDRDRYIVTEVEFSLTRGATPSLGYADIERYFRDQPTAPTLASVAQAVRVIRGNKGMVVPPGAFSERDPDTRSAGSFFKNPVVPLEVRDAIASSLGIASMPSYPVADTADGAAQCKLPAAWLLEQAGFGKGFALGGAAVSSKHTLALTNHSGHATAVEVEALRDRLVQGVQERFGVTLEPEPIVVG